MRSLIPGADPRLQGERELGQVNEALLARVRRVVGEGLAHQEGVEAGSLKPGLHLPDGLQGHKGVEMAVKTDHVCARLRHPAKMSNICVYNSVQTLDLVYTTNG